MTIPRSSRSIGESSVTSAPSKTMRPDVGGSRPEMTFSSVDLPGAVGAEQRDDRALGNGEVGVEQDLHLAVGRLDAVAPEQGVLVADGDVGGRAGGRIVVGLTRQARDVDVASTGDGA